MNLESSDGAGGVVVAVLLPHAPILVPAVGGDNSELCRSTIVAMQSAARTLVAAWPDLVVLVSPHAERVSGAFGLTHNGVSGSLAHFGAPRAAVAFPGAAKFSAALRAAAVGRGLEVIKLAGERLDHGAVVPLWYLAQAGWSGPTVVLSLRWSDNSRVAELGECLAAVAAKEQYRVGVVASGDMSHRLKPGAPGGFDPHAAEFDAAFIGQLRGGATRELAGAVEALRECAGEDVVESTEFAFGATGWRSEGRDVIGYEGPFGVGYGVAVLFAEMGRSGADREMPSTGGVDLVAVARASIAAALGVGAGEGEPCVGACPGSNGVFVTLHEAGGALRGCIGTMGSRTGDLAVDTWRMAREAALHDPRFPPLQPAELATVRIVVTLLGAMEDVASPESLDPQRWGVVVRTADGRRGLLLPDLPSVVSVEQQLSIAKAKAGISPGDPVQLQRFAAWRIEEKGCP